VKATPIFALPFPEETDPPDGAAQIEAAVDRVEEVLAEIEGLLLGEPAAGNLVIVNGTNDPVYKAATGDVTNNSAGVFSIGEEKVATTMVKNLAITAAKLAEEAVSTAKLLNLNVTEGKLANLAVAAGKLASECVETGKIKALAVTTAKIALLAITEGLIADGAVTSRKFKPTTGIKHGTGAEGTIGGVGATRIEPGILFNQGYSAKLFCVITAFWKEEGAAAGTQIGVASYEVGKFAVKSEAKAPGEVVGEGGDYFSTVGTLGTGWHFVTAAVTLELTAAEREVFMAIWPLTVGGGNTTKYLPKAWCLQWMLTKA
jgi:hypothetical protein